MFRHASTFSYPGHNVAWAPRALRRAVGTLVAAVALSLSFSHAQNAPIQAVATIGMIGDIASELGAQCADVDTLMGPGIDPHLYQATSGDVRALGRANLILYAGLTLEGQLGDVLGRFAERTPTVAVSEASIEEDQRIRTNDDYGVDPHVWMDVALWAQTIPVIADALTGVAPDCAEGIEHRAESLAVTLEALDGWIAEAVATIPEQQRVLVTAHDAFAYYGRAYGLDVVGIQGVSTEAEPSIADIRATAETLARAGVPAVFVETTINPRTIQAVLDAAADLGHDAHRGGSLYSDAMGEPGTAAGTYVGMLHANTSSIVTALGGRLLPLPEAMRAWAARFGIEMDAATP